MTETESRYKKIYKMVEQIPRGQVATYGQIARLVGLPRHARMVGYALHALPNDNNVPWQRVVNAKGEVSPRATPQYEDLQRHLLECEGVVFSDAGRISLKTYQWKRL
ncbi:MAG: MGMT family protein [Planctomycetota bacterium]|nr:MGMT family protein [Planctomycetota bacterium]